MAKSKITEVEKAEKKKAKAEFENGIIEKVEETNDVLNTVIPTLKITDIEKMGVKPLRALVLAVFAEQCPVEHKQQMNAMAKSVKTKAKSEKNPLAKKHLFIHGKEHAANLVVDRLVNHPELILVKPTSKLFKQLHESSTENKHLTELWPYASAAYFKERFPNCEKSTSKFEDLLQSILELKVEKVESESKTQNEVPKNEQVKESSEEIDLSGCTDQYEIIVALQKLYEENPTKENREFLVATAIQNGVEDVEFLNEILNAVPQTA